MLSRKDKNTTLKHYIELLTSKNMKVGMHVQIGNVRVNCASNIV
jgi:hypothetical protein